MEVNLFSIQIPDPRLFFGWAGGWLACFALNVLCISWGIKQTALLSLYYSPARGLWVGHVCFIPIERHLGVTKKDDE
jgi:hypothetical protein